MNSKSHLMTFRKSLSGRSMPLSPILSLLVGLFVFVANGAADEASVLEYLSYTEGTEYLQQGDFRIERVKSHDVPMDSIVFQKFVKNIPLHGGRVVVFEEMDGLVGQVFDDSSEQLRFNFGKPAFTAAAAEAKVEESTANFTGSDSQLVWFRIGDEAVLAWEITTALADSGEPAAPTGLESVVDVSTGEVLSQRQLDDKTYLPGSPEVADSVYPRIVINNTIGAAGSRAYAAPFDAVVEVAFGCSGTLIADDVVLCARHCGVGAGSTIIFGDNSNNGGIFSRTVQSSFLPDGNGSLLDGGDVAILTLTQSDPANIAAPMRLIDQTNELEGQVCAMLGYGFNGLGSVGHQNSADGFRWGGENIIDVYGSPAAANGSNIISTDFDNGSGGANTIGGSSPTPVQFEATTAPGDSGGPVLVQVGDEHVIAGVLSGGTTGNSVFGDISWWTGTAIYRTAIEARGGVFISDTEISIVGDSPEFVSSAGGDMIDINVVPSDTDPLVTSSGILHVDTGSGFADFPLAVNSATSFTGTFPPSECLSTVEFYISFQLQSGATVTLPPNAPANSFSALSATDFLNLFSDSFETNLGWTVSGNATDGQWERGIPNNGDRGDPVADVDSSGAGFCFLTDNGNIPDDNTDVDGGSTTLTSPIMDATSGSDEIALLSYYRWYSNDAGASPGEDVFIVEISNDAGVTWTNLETVGPSGPGTMGTWIFVEHQIDQIVTPTSLMRVRFTASDEGDGSVVEAGVDAFAINVVSCADDDDVLLGDVNLDGLVNLLDVAPFVDLISNGVFQAEADINQDGTINLLDVGPFVDLLSGG